MTKYRIGRIGALRQDKPRHRTDQDVALTPSRGIARNLFRMGTKQGNWDISPSGGSRGKAMEGVWGRRPQKLDIHMQSAADKRIFQAV